MLHKESVLKDLINPTQVWSEYWLQPNMIEQNINIVTAFWLLTLYMGLERLVLRCFVF